MSSSFATRSAMVCMRSAIAAYEMSGAASVTPAMSPLSCWGKKPFGIRTYRMTVIAIVASITSSTRN